MNDDVLVLGRMPVEEKAQKLMELGELRELSGIADDETLQSGFELKSLFSPVTRAWEHTSYAVGFLAEGSPGADLVPLEDAAAMTADAGLRGARLDLTLDRLRVADYPGRGPHRILFDLAARGGGHAWHFTVPVRAREGATSAVLGLPALLGLGAGAEGLSLRCVTVNVKNDDDEGLFAAFEADSLRRGLQLAPGSEAAAGALGALSSGLTRALARRHRNAALQDFSIGLDFGGTPGAARLRLGTYFVVQAPEDAAPACWQTWAYHRTNGVLVNRSDPRKALSYNYLALQVRRHG